MLCLDWYYCRESSELLPFWSHSVWYLSLFSLVVLYLNTNITGKGNVIWLEDLGILGSWLLSSTWVIFIWKSNKTKVITCLMT